MRQPWVRRHHCGARSRPGLRGVSRFSRSWHHRSALRNAVQWKQPGGHPGSTRRSGQRHAGRVVQQPGRDRSPAAWYPVTVTGYNGRVSPGGPARLEAGAISPAGGGARSEHGNRPERHGASPRLFPSRPRAPGGRADCLVAVAARGAEGAEAAHKRPAAVSPTPPHRTVCSRRSLRVLARERLFKWTEIFYRD
jgi:hypothetical protein